MLQLDWTLLATGLVFLVTLWALNNLMFRPLLGVLDERRVRSVETQKEAAGLLRSREALLAQYETRIREQRQQGYQLADAVRREAGEARLQRIGQAREEAERLLDEAKAKVQEEVVAAKAELRRGAEQTAQIIVSRILERS
ncbi:MAG: ATP synthase F0 subunit B [Acidobacteriota bacterium]